MHYPGYYDAKHVVDFPTPVGASERSEASQRSAPPQRRARERVGESEGRSPSDHFDAIEYLISTPSTNSAVLRWSSR